MHIGTGTVMTLRLKSSRDMSIYVPVGYDVSVKVSKITRGAPYGTVPVFYGTVPNGADPLLCKY